MTPEVDKTYVTSSAEAPLIVYAGYFPIYEHNGGFNSIERAKILYLLHRNVNLVYLQGGTARAESYPSLIRENLVIPPKMLAFSKIRGIGYLYFGLFALLECIRRSRRRRVIALFMGPEMVPYGLMLKFWKRLPFICYLGDCWHANPRSVVDVGWWRYRSIRLLERMAQFASATILVNPEELAHLQRTGFPAHRFHYIPFGCEVSEDVERYSVSAIRENTRKELGFRSDQVIVAFHGFGGAKNNLTAATKIVNEIAPDLEKRCPEVVFLIVGMERESIPGHNVPSNTVFLKYLEDRDELLRCLSAADLYVVPMDIGAGMKTKVLDALSVGLPVIATPHVAGAFESSDCPLIVARLESISSTIASMARNLDFVKQIGVKSRGYMALHYGPKAHEKLIELIHRVG